MKSYKVRFFPTILKYIVSLKRQKEMLTTILWENYVLVSSRKWSAWGSDRFVKKDWFSEFFISVTILCPKGD